MSSARALLTSLQDRTKRSPASCCRQQDAKAAILAAGLEPLLELATDPELRRGDELELLLKLLVLILTDNSEAKTKEGEGGALALAMQTLQDVVAGSGGSGRSVRKRTKLLKRALELVGVLANTSEAQQQRKWIISTLVMLLTRTSEDASLLLRATDVLGRFVDGSLDRIQLAANEDAIAILIGLLKLIGGTTELKRTACEVLLLMGEAPRMLQTMVTQNIVSVLGLCLRTETPGCETEAGVVRLLLRLTREARVFGQIVHEEMVPLLFRVVERNSNLGEITAMACTLIADLSEFARQCKLDLSPFLEVTACRGKVLVLAATSHAQDAAVVDNTFRFFVNVSWNPVDLPQLINPETIEGLLSLYVLAGGSGYLAELAEHLVHVISRLSRSMIEQFTIQDEDVTLPALFLCLRNCHEDVRFASQVFAILTKHWKTQTMQSSFCDMHLCENDPVPSVGSDEEEMLDADAENVDEGNDDDSDDDDGYEKADDAIRSLPERQGPPSPSKCASRSKCTSINAFSHLEDKTWFYVDPAGVKYPKHPSRMDQAGQTNDDEGFLLEEPSFLEPCNVPNPEETTRFIEEATAKRAEFLADDINMRARIVYENTSMLEDWPRDKIAGIPAVLLNSCQPASHYPYSVPDKSKAFADLPTSLTFDSCFESGNLERAIQIGEYEYDLILRRDFNSSGHMQWFYFAVSNIQPAKESISYPQRGQKWRFNIVNLCKPSSLFNHGLQPVVYSVKDAHENQRGWLRSGTDIYYFANPFVRAPRSAGSSSDALPTDAVPVPANLVGTYYTLTFTLEFRNTDDTYLIAHSYPYTLTMHQLHLSSILHRSGRDMHQILRRSSLCTTLSGRNCDLLTISDFSVGLQEVKARKAVFITSRVHPGEAQASWMMRGVIDFLLGDSDVARVLRRMFLFQIIPILNPDGVYFGNSRCALSACDLNRQWQNPSRAQHPTIFHAKELLFKERSSRGVAFYCDMHGHSRKKNVFMYGCDTKRKPNPIARTFAKLFSMQQTAKKYISFPDCSFKVSKNKETTARVVVASELKICWSFTLEASFCGANFGELQNAHFNTKHLHQVGTSLCETLFQACVGDANVRERLAANIDDATMCIPQYVEGYLREAGVLNDRSSVAEDVTTNPRAALQKGKSGPGKKMPIDSSLKTASRKNPKSKVVGNSDSGARKVIGDADEGSARRRKPSRQYPKPSMFAGPIELDDGEMRGVSVAASAADGSARRLDLAGLSRAKVSGKKLRNKYPRTRRTKSSPSEHVTSHRRPMPCLGSNETGPADDLSSRANGGSLSGDPTMPLVPAKPVATATGPPSSSVRGSFTSFQNSETAYLRSPKSASFSFPTANMLGVQSRDCSMVLPPPVNDVVTRSPKVPINRMRFRQVPNCCPVEEHNELVLRGRFELTALQFTRRGAGRQFAAVNTGSKISLHDILVRTRIELSTCFDDSLSLILVEFA
ncbi:hypothetical protein BBJ28_00001811 [Nothophytophthora sp. Chile5]|nr:hypothetical protein BBJ28_00001811 [Nothophytophthora sp. Chile5]